MGTIGCNSSWRRGETFRREECVEVFRKVDRSRVSAQRWITDIKFLEFLSSFLVDDCGMQLQNVARLAWLVESRVEKDYW